MGRHSSRSKHNPLETLVLHQCMLSERYEVLRDIGDGSFGTVALARRKDSGQERTLVAIKSMKKPIEPPGDCLKLREVQSLYALPSHPAIVTVLESFYDPRTRLFHMVMEQMDQNLYQLIRSRQNQRFDIDTVKNILQILGALEHCHANNFFHRDIKPENVLVTSLHSPTHKQQRMTSASSLLSTSQHFLTPPSTPAQYQVKLADFGLAREISSRPPYTSYVSTRWYRAPEVLLRAEHYSAPVDMWAFGAMAVELATLSPLFPGKNEVDQVWRICEIMGSPADWRTRANRCIGGGAWKDAARYAEKLGFSFPKVAPIQIEEILGPAWPISLAALATELLRWDPDTRPTSSEALRHEFFVSQGEGIISAMVVSGTSACLTERLPMHMDPMRGFFKNVQQSLQRRPSMESIRSTMSHLRATRSTESHQATPRDNHARENVTTNTHRQSWFAKTRDTIVGHHANLEPHADIPAQNTRSKARDVQIWNSANDPPGHLQPPSEIMMPSESLLLPMQPISPMQDVTPVIAQNTTTNRFLHQKQRVHLRQSQEVCSVNDRELRASQRAFVLASNIPIRVPGSTKTRKNSRSVSEYSIEHSPSLKNTREQNISSERHSGIGGLFAHLRKKTKRSEQPTSVSCFHEPDQMSSTLYEALPGVHHASETREQLGYSSKQKQCHRAVHEAPERQAESQHILQLSQSLPAEKSPLVLRSMSLAESKRRPHEQFTIASRDFSALPTPHSSGPVSSRTRRAVSQAKRSVKTLHSDEIPDEEAEMLDAELQSTAHAMKHLAAFPEFTVPGALLKPVPSYAKSTAASTRRSSNFNAMSGSLGKHASRKVTEQKNTYPRSPLSDDTMSPLLESHA